MDINLDQNGVSPKALAVAAGATVTFHNNDTVPHQIASNPHPAHTQCPELNLPVIQPGMSASAVMGSTYKFCGYHGEANPGDTAFDGSVVVSTSTGTGGSGY